MGKYLSLARQAELKVRAGPRPVPGRGKGAPRRRSSRSATKATEATKVTRQSTRRRDRSDGSQTAQAITLTEALAEINREDSGPAKNAELYRRGYLAEEKAVEYVTCAILNRRGEGFERWRKHAPTVRAALTHDAGCGCEMCQ